MEQSQLREKLLRILQQKNASLKEHYPDDVVDFLPQSFPLSLRSSFPQYQSFVLEMGCGWGEFAIKYGQSRPSELYLALDKKKYRIKKSITEVLKLRQIKKEAQLLGNLKWMLGNFEWFFEGLFEGGTFNKIIINFPDPWPKQRHQKHRFLRTDIIRELARISVKEASLEFATDNWSYMEKALVDFNEEGSWINQNGKNVILPVIPGRPQSFFELEKRSEKENIYFIQLKTFRPR